MILFIVWLSWLLWPIAQTKFNMYNTDETLDIGSLKVHCLHYYSPPWYTRLEKIEFCLDSTTNKNSWSDDFVNIRDRNFTFDKLRQLHVTAIELLSWSATIDLAERYQYYLDYQNESSASKEIYFNCTKPWFGPRCQYSFNIYTANWFFDIVYETSKDKDAYDVQNSVPHVTCYMHLKCDRGGLGMCLDWREVCDGRIDCIDGGADEAQCFDLEMNECNENEYRCHNGLCIPKEVLGYSDIIGCLDTTHLFNELYVFYRDYSSIFINEEQSCRPNYKQFTCGLKQCVSDFDECKSKRHILLIESISIQGNLSYTCWMAMICLTKILDQINGTSCDQFFESFNISTYLQTCDDFILFPTVPVLFGHVRFLYRLKDVLRDWNVDSSLTPDYICYDQQLCDFLTPTYFNGKYSCRHRSEFDLDWNMKLENWVSLISFVERYFRKCLIRYNSNDNKHYANHPALYCCKNSSKCISKHRILDNISDCYLNDDEEQFELSCLIQDERRFKCGKEKKCYSTLFSKKICPSRQLRNFNDIEFRDICDRHVQMFPLIIDGQNHTDETECEHWPCNNIYTRCDGFWSCPNGTDEENCTTKLICPSHTLPCISPYNYTLICLPANQVGNEHIDCLGALDELQYCRTDYYLDRTFETYNSFRCWNDSECVSSESLCDMTADCPLKDDEILCGNNTCMEVYSSSLDTDIDLADVQKIICDTYNVKWIAFPEETLPIYPPSESRTTAHITQRRMERRYAANVISKKSDDSLWPWYCNHGVYVHHWLGGNNFSYKCFCPPTYYGDKCQYQNQRVSFTAVVKQLNTYNIYAIIISLIDDNDDRQEIISHNQFTSTGSMGVTFAYVVYLTYASRPKNNSKNYSVRTDAFDKTSMAYIGSWHFIIPFSYLPVNRMPLVLYVPIEEVPNPSNCLLTCHHGKCTKYINKDKFFCRCYSGWSGIRCDIPIRCSDCSSDSICIGVIHNRSICVCPFNKGGPRCMLSFSCANSKCSKNRTCFLRDDDMYEKSSLCRCMIESFNGLCNGQKNEVEISFPNIKLASYLTIYQFSWDSDLVSYMDDVLTYKLRMFQRTVSHYWRFLSNMAFARIDDTFYLVFLHPYLHFDNISISIDSNQRCASINEVLNSQLVHSHQIRRMKYYYLICQTHSYLMCFLDEPYMCLCTNDRHASCFKFKASIPKCPYNTHCQNGAECYLDNIYYSTQTMCICTGCFYGDRCQYPAKGIGLTLDDILHYDIRPNTTIHDQTSIVKWSSALTIIMFVAGLINSVLSIITFRTKTSREVGCGLYLLVSSVTSLLTISIFTMKFWFLLLTQIYPSISYSGLRAGCISFEFMMKVCLYMDNWLNACVALERFVTVYKGVSFNKALSKRIARWIIIILLVSIMISIIHEPIYRDLFDDKEEERLWCVLHHSSPVQIYNTIIIFFHFIGPFCANLFSALFIIIASARRRAITQKRLKYKEHLRQQFKEHKNLIISPIVLVILSIPRLLISLATGCVKESRNSWLYLSGYLVSFIPSMSIFIVFVIPSEFYRSQFKESILSCRR